MKLQTPTLQISSNFSFLKVKATRVVVSTSIGDLLLLSSTLSLFLFSISGKQGQSASEVRHHSPMSLMLYYAKLQTAYSQVIRLFSTPFFWADIRHLVVLGSAFNSQPACQEQLTLKSRGKEFDTESGFGNSVQGMSVVHKI